MLTRSALRAAIARFTELFRQQRIERERDEEFQFHLECEIAQRIAHGASPEAARRDASLAFGGVARFAEDTREARGFARLDAIVRDVRFALRRLRRAPAFTIGSVATLGVGLGVAAGIGTVVYGVLLRPLPFPDSARLVEISVLTPGLGVATTAQSEGTFIFFSERARSYGALGAYMENSAVSITDGDTPERVPVALLTPNMLGILGVIPAAGHLLTDADAAQGFTSPVLISYDLWQRRYGGASGAVGQYIELNRGRRLIAGVLPHGFAFPSPETAIYYPMRIEATRAGLGYRNIKVVGRLARGATSASAQAEVDALLPHLGERFPEIAGEPLTRAHIAGRVESMREATIAPVRAELRLLAALVGALLIIAGANVATLALLRAERLQIEVAVIRALGASAGAVRQRFIVESVVVSLMGAVLAIPIATIAVTAKLGATDAQLPRLHEVAMTPMVVVAIIATAVLVGLALGPIMAARAARAESTSLRVNARATPSRGWQRIQRLLVGVQIALAMALLVDASLFTASIFQLRRVDLGFVARDGAQFALQLPFRGYSTLQRTVAFDLGVVDALRRTPGISDAAAVMELPSTPQLLDMQPALEVTRSDGTHRSAVARINVASPNYFRVMGIPLRAGRTFAPGDLVSPNPGVVLSAALARDLFGAENPVGREVRFVTDRYAPSRVVGVSGDVFAERVSDGALRSIYYPLLDDLAPTSTETEQRVPIMPGSMHFVIRSTLPLETLLPASRAAVRAIDPRMPVWDVRTLDQIVAATTARLRLSMLLLTASALATLLLGAIGIYSVVAYSMVGRAPELAVRIALGASPKSVSRLVYRESAYMVACGVIAGLALSFAGSRIVRGLLYDVSATDVRFLAASVGIVALVAAMAVFAPARRAARTDPAAVLRG